MKIDHNYLPRQFADIDAILDDIVGVVKRADFTLGREVAELEHDFARMVGTRHAIGVANGTDAIFLALKALGVKPGCGNVITTPYSFYATASMIHHAGAMVQIVDVDRDFNLNPDFLEKSIMPATVGIVIVHWAGRPCRMNDILDIAKEHGLWVIEDCAHAHGSTYHDKGCGSIGDIGAFSLHPLKNVNVWGDGGVITTDSDKYAEWLRKARNHGMTDRNTCEFWGWNSRLDTIQAVVAKHVLAHLPIQIQARRFNARLLDDELQKIPQIELPVQRTGQFCNYYLYTFHAERRDELRDFLVQNGVDAKVHYPVPLHKQPAAKVFGPLKEVPVAEWCANTTLSLPVHEFITEEDIETMTMLVRRFYDRS